MDTKEKAAPKKSTYIVESPVLHDRRYEIGEEIDLTDAEATPMLEVGSISHREHASREAREAPKQREEADKSRQAAAARDDLSVAEAEHERATEALKDAQAKVDDAKRRVEVAKERVSRAGKVAAAHPNLPHTWEQDADRLGGDQLGGTQHGGSVQGEPAKAPAHGAASTNSTPTREAVEHDKAKSKK